MHRWVRWFGLFPHSSSIASNRTQATFILRWHQEGCRRLLETCDNFRPSAHIKPIIIQIAKKIEIIHPQTIRRPDQANSKTTGKWVETPWEVPGENATSTAKSWGHLLLRYPKTQKKLQQQQHIRATRSVWWRDHRKRSIVKEFTAETRMLKSYENEKTSVIVTWQQVAFLDLRHQGRLNQNITDWVVKRPVGLEIGEYLVPDRIVESCWFWWVIIGARRKAEKTYWLYWRIIESRSQNHYKDNQWFRFVIVNRY